MKSKAFTSLVICMCFILSSRSQDSTRLYNTSDLLYADYREGVIKRHIASNGGYRDFILLRSADNIDFGQYQRPSEMPDIPVFINRRDMPAPTLPLVPVAYYDLLNDFRTVPQNFIKSATIGYVKTKPAPGLIPLYEWSHNVEREENPYEDFYYSTDIDSDVARFRYKINGIIGFVVEDAQLYSEDSDLSPLFVGYDQTNWHHVLTTDKSQNNNLSNFEQIGYIFDTTCSRNEINFLRDMATLNEFRKIGVARHCPYFYSATKEISGQQFLTRQVVSGGGDNPLYQTGLALAVFSLESLHDLSPNSITYAKLLFEYIERSEEAGINVLTDHVLSRTGYLRRKANSWHNATTWGASTDELVGVLMGLKYFIKATAITDPVYNERAKQLLNRIGNYLYSRDWIYLDTRESPTTDNIVELARKARLDDESEEAKILGRAFGTLPFEYPISTLFEEILGPESNYRRGFLESYDLYAKLLNEVVPNAWETVISLSTGQGTGDILFGSPIKSFMTMVALANLSCLTEVLSDDVTTSILTTACIFTGGLTLCGLAALSGFADNYEMFDYGCGSVIDTHKEFYQLLVRNAGAYELYFGPADYYNYTMIAYLGLLLLSPESPISDEDRHDFAKAYVGFINAQWGLLAQSSQGSNDWHFNGDGKNNALFALLANRCFQILSNREIESSFIHPHLDNRHRKLTRIRMNDEVNYILSHYITAGPRGNINVVWQPKLPLKNPSDASHSDSEWGNFKSISGRGIGSNQAWERPNIYYENEIEDETYRMPDITLSEWLNKIGPWYNGGLPCITWYVAYECQSLADSVNYFTRRLEELKKARAKALERYAKDGLTHEDFFHLAPYNDTIYLITEKLEAKSQKLDSCLKVYPNQVCITRGQTDISPDVALTKEILVRQARVAALMNFEQQEELIPYGGYDKFQLAIEAGGLDYMLVRMLMVEFGMANAPEKIPGRYDIQYPVLPVAAATPW